MPEPESKRPRVVLTGKREHDGTRGGATLQAASSWVSSSPSNSRPSNKAHLSRVEKNAAAKAGSAKLTESTNGLEANGASATNGKDTTVQLHKSSDLVVFDVGGTTFNVREALIRSAPGALLHQLLDGKTAANKSGSGDVAPIYVDANGDRFSLILDWYRYGQIHVPYHIPINSVLRDIQYFGLPDGVVVNGIPRSRNHDCAAEISRELASNVIRRWPAFSTFFNKVLDDAKKHFKEIGDSSSGGRQTTSAATDEDVYDFSPFVFPIYEEKGWCDKNNVCSAQRARVLALKLEECGFFCEFTDNDLVVSLPNCSLRGDDAPVPEGDIGPDEPAN